MGITSKKEPFDLKKCLDRISAHLDKDEDNIAELKSLTHVCKFLGYCTNTWYKYKDINKDNEELMSTIKKLEQLQYVWWVDSGLDKKVNTTAWIFCMKNIFGWRDIREIEEGTNNLVKITYNGCKKSKVA